MSSTKAIYAAGLLGTIGALALSLWIKHQSDIAHEQVVSAAKRCASLRLRIIGIQNSERETKRRLTRINESPTLANVTPEYESRGKIDHLKKLDTDTQLQVQRMKARRACLFASYDQFYRAHGMSLDAIRRFEEIFMKREEDTEDLSASRRLQRYSPDDPAIRQLEKESQESFRKALVEVVGDNGLQDFLEYNRTSMMREYVGGIIGNATVHGIDFTQEQSDQLVSAFAASSSSYLKGGWATNQDIDWEQVDKAAASFLSPEQMQAFRTLESRGPNFFGSRALSRLNAAISDGVKADAVEKITQQNG